MGEQTSIQWTNHTWNPWRGCQKVSPGCKNCYMFSEQTRYGQDPSVVQRTKTWKNPHIWQRAALNARRTEMVFTCSFICGKCHIGAGVDLRYDAISGLLEVRCHQCHRIVVCIQPKEAD